jgi:hypothetical protein
MEGKKPKLDSTETHGARRRKVLKSLAVAAIASDGAKAPAVAGNPPPPEQTPRRGVASSAP